MKINIYLCSPLAIATEIALKSKNQQISYLWYACVIQYSEVSMSFDS